MMIFLYLSLHITGQTTFSWVNYTSNSAFTPWTSQSYEYTLTGSGFTDYALATITSSGGTSIFKSSTPKYTSSGDPAAAGCASAPAGLYVSVDWPNASQNVTIVVSFDGDVNGVCGPVSFSLYDVNDDGFGSWNDAVDVSAVNSAGTALSISKSADCNANGASPATTVTFSGNTSSSCTCWGNNTVTIGTAAAIIKTVTIKYYSKTTPSTYNVSPQYIVISNITTGGFGCASITLPIDLVSFAGKCSGLNNTFQWTTAREENNSHFTLQESTDGAVFEDAISIKGNGTSTVPHNYEAVLPVGKAKYFRLKQVDLNGDEKFSRVIYVNCNEVSIDHAALFPNPADGNIHLEFISKAETELSVSITDVTGKGVASFTQQAHDGYNSIELFTESLPTGAYSVKVSDPSNLNNTKFLKLFKE